MSDDLQSWLDDASEEVDRRASSSTTGRSFDDVMQRAAAASDVELAEEALTGFIVEARETVDRRVEGAARRAGFDDVMLRAHALAPEIADGAKVTEARNLAPVVNIRRAPEERELDRFVDDAREGVESKVDARRMAPIGSAPVPAENSPSRAGRWVAAGLLVAAAVFATVSISAPRVLEPEAATEASEAEQAMLLEGDRSTAPSGEAVRVEPAPVRKPKVHEPAPTEVAPVPEPKAKPHKAKKSQPARPSLSDLAAEAKTQWRAGQLGAAERTLKQIVSRGGKSRWADNAYSDLFALAHQRGDASARRRWWRAYLKRFPKGRFSDDAQAGLCRGAAAERRAGCWETYLQRHPAGSYRAEASRVTKK